MALAAPFPPVDLPFPPDLISAVRDQAERDANCVAVFLAALGLEASQEKHLCLPANFLLYLGGALRLWLWEQQGLYLHRDAGLPDARQAIKDAFRSLAEPNLDARKIGVRILYLLAERFAWHAPAALGADVVLDDLGGDAALEALAEFLWAARHGPALPGGPRP